MSNKDPDEITRIEDLPNINRSEDESDFVNLEDMAQSLGIDSLEDSSDETPPEFNEMPIETQSEFSEQEDDFLDSTDESFDSQENDFLEDSQDEFNSNIDESQFSSEHDELLDSQDSDFDSHFEETNNDDSFDFQEEDNGETSIKSDEFQEVQQIQSLDDLTQSEQFDLPKQDEIIEEVIGSTEAEIVVKSETPKELEGFKAPETFSDVGEFTKNITHASSVAEGNPPFSIIIKNPKYEEEVKEIANIIIEYSFFSEDKKEEVIDNLTRGQLLIPRISEYAAIYLTHKLRAFDIEILVGLTEEVNPPKSYKSNDRGLSSKTSLLRKKQIFYDLKDKNQSSSIITTTLPYIEGHTISKHLGIVTHTKLLSSSELKSQLEDRVIDQIDSKDLKEKTQKHQMIMANINASNSKLFDSMGDRTETQHESNNLDQIYAQIINELKLKIEQDGTSANAILGINFTVTPIHIDEYPTVEAKYQIVCSGNIVCLEKN